MTTLEETKITNVVRPKEDPDSTNNKDNKVDVEYNLGFRGDEFLKLQPESFEAYGRISRINSADLAAKISSYFRLTFHEFRGCNIYTAPNGQISVEIFFEKNGAEVPESKIPSLDLLSNPSNPDANDIYSKMQAINNRRTGKVYTLNNETRLLLSQFMYGGDKANKPNNKKVWNNESIVSEIHIPNNDPLKRAPYNSDRILMRVRGLDIRRILRELYGSALVTKTDIKDSGDVNYYAKDVKYEVRWAKGCPDGTFIMSIEQFDSVAVEKLFIKENPMPQNLGITMY